jgi:hypothetical protein
MIECFWNRSDNFVLLCFSFDILTPTELFWIIPQFSSQAGSNLFPDDVEVNVVSESKAYGSVLRREGFVLNEFLSFCESFKVLTLFK